MNWFHWSGTNGSLVALSLNNVNHSLVKNVSHIVKVIMSPYVHFHLVPALKYEILFIYNHRLVSEGFTVCTMLPHWRQKRGQVLYSRVFMTTLSPHLCIKWFPLLKSHINMTTCTIKKKKQSTRIKTTNKNICQWHSPSPLDSIRDAVLTVSPNKQYLGIFKPTTPAQTGPIKHKLNIVTFYSGKK